MTSAAWQMKLTGEQDEVYREMLRAGVIMPANEFAKLPRNVGQQLSAWASAVLWVFNGNDGFVPPTPDWLRNHMSKAQFDNPVGWMLDVQEEEPEASVLSVLQAVVITLEEIRDLLSHSAS